MMRKLRRVLQWLGLAMIVLLIVMSVYAPFIGAARAQQFFNSVPLTLYWFAFVVLLILSVMVIRRLHRAPGLLLIHVGCILILGGSMWASEAGHSIQKKLFGIDKFMRGAMQIFEGKSENKVQIPDSDEIRVLPFSIRLRDFRLEYYKTGSLFVKSPEGDKWRFRAEVGAEYPLSPKYGSIRITKAFRNFRIDTEGEKKIPFDDPGPGNNPALEIQIISSDETTTRQYVFERFSTHEHPDKEEKLELRYFRPVSDYISDLEVVKEDIVVVEKTIEVNYPLHYGGYYLYQHGYDPEEGKYTVLMVVSDSGIFVVFGGFLALMAGLIWHFWLKPVLSRIELNVDKDETNGS